jgi:hypothetical protein
MSRHLREVLEVNTVDEDMVPLWPRARATLALWLVLMAERCFPSDKCPTCARHLHALTRALEPHVSHLLGGSR